MQLSVIIVNFNVKYFLEQCLSSVLKACKNITAEIFVVDNNSTDDSREYFTNRFSTVQFIWQNENTGFAKANNEALKFVTGNTVLFLNPDTIVPEDCFEKCLSFISSTINCGAVGVKMIDGSGNYLPESKRGFPSVFTSFCKMSGLTKIFPHSKIFARYYLGHLSPLQTHEVNVIAGAFMMIQKKVLDVTGSFDEDFFMYGEDIDLSYRLQNAGYKNFYFADSSILHFKGESTNKHSLNYIKIFYSSMSLFVKKHYHGTNGWAYNLFIHVAIWIKAIFSGFGSLFKAFNPNRKKLQTTIRKSLIIAERNEFKILLDLISLTSNQYQIIGRVSATGDDNIDVLGNLNEINDLVKRYAINEIIFCENGISFFQMIEMMQQLPKGLMFKLHATGTGSIVGSNNKDSVGEFIALNN